MKTKKPLLLHILIGIVCVALICTIIVVAAMASSDKGQGSNQDLYDAFKQENITAYYSDFEQYSQSNPVPISEINFNSEDVGWLYAYTIWFYETYPDYDGANTYDAMYAYSASMK